MQIQMIVPSELLNDVTQLQPNTWTKCRSHDIYSEDLRMSSLKVLQVHFYAGK